MVRRLGRIVRAVPVGDGDRLGLLLPDADELLLAARRRIDVHALLLDFDRTDGRFLVAVVVVEGAAERARSPRRAMGGRVLWFWRRGTIQNTIINRFALKRQV